MDITKEDSHGPGETPTSREHDYHDQHESTADRYEQSDRHGPQTPANDADDDNSDLDTGDSDAGVEDDEQPENVQQELERAWAQRDNELDLLDRPEENFGNREPQPRPDPLARPGRPQNFNRPQGRHGDQGRHGGDRHRQGGGPDRDRNRDRNRHGGDQNRDRNRNDQGRHGQDRDRNRHGEQGRPGDPQRQGQGRHGDQGRHDQNRDRHQQRHEQGRERHRDDRPRDDRNRDDRNRDDRGRDDRNRELNRGDMGRHGEQPRHEGQRHDRQRIKKQILTNTTPDETRVAIIENDRLAELFIDRHIGGADKVVGNIYMGRVENVLPGISSAFIDVGQEKNAYLYISDVLGDTREKDIGKLLKKGSTIMVQVAKEAIGTKGMKVTMDISLPGRFLILMPLSEHVGVSRQVEEHSERERLRKIVEGLNPPGGVIVRTEAEGADERALKREMKYLTRLWDQIQKRAEKVHKGLVHKELGLTFQIVRDILSEDVEAFLLDSRQEYDDVKGFVEMLAPELVERIRLYEGRTPIFSSFNIEEELQHLRQARVDLPSGGYIIIQEAESLCAIDVNTGKFTGRNSQEETVTATNIEAAAEVARQLRLRNIGGIIVIDFIDMKKRRNRDKVMEALASATRADHAKIKILPITRLGLVEMTRERRRESLQSMTGEACPQCNGSGWVLSRDSLFLKIRKEIIDMTQGRPDGSLKIYLKGPVAQYLKENKERLEKQVSRGVEIFEDNTLDWEHYRLILE